jgi:hypothetical protein
MRVLPNAFLDESVTATLFEDEMRVSWSFVVPYVQ